MPLLDGTSLFQMTVDRVTGIEKFGRLIVITGANQCQFVNKQLGEWSSRADVLIEPEGRDSAPAIALAALHVSEIDPDGVLVVVASDHYVPDENHFRHEMVHAANAAEEGGIVTVGIKPHEPSSAYGYIQPEADEARVKRIHSFVEKPNESLAVTYLDAGYFWNSGNFIVSAETLLSEFRAYAPLMLKTVQEALLTAHPVSDGLRLGGAFLEAEKISFDYAIMEKCKQAKVLCSDLAWSDLGAWDAVHAVLPKDEYNNALTDDDVVIDSRSNLIHSDGKQAVALLGVHGMSVVVQEDVIFVAPLSRAQDVKSIVNKLKKLGRPEIDVAKPKFCTAEIYARLEAWLLNDALPKWWANGFDMQACLWRESLDRQTSSPTHQNRRARIQGRQAYVMAIAGHMGWAGPVGFAIRKTLDGVDRHYRRDDGLLRTVVSDDLSSIDDAVLLYDQTFILLALAHSQGIVDNAIELAVDHLDAIESAFSRPIDETLPNKFAGFVSGIKPELQSNPHMHLLEASLAWVEKSNGAVQARFKALAGNIVDLACANMIDADGGFIREYFDGNWQAAKGPEGETVEPGHQFEWAWLLCRWATLYNSPNHIDVARKLFANGIHGFDAGRNVIIMTVDSDLKPVDRQARLWPQTEWLKAACSLKSHARNDEEREFYNTQIELSLSAIEMYLETSLSGMWYDKLERDGTFVDEPVPVSSLYHLVCAIDELGKI